MVRRWSVTLVLAAAIGSVSISGQTAAPDTKLFTSTGIVKKVSDPALTIAMNNGEMTFAIAPSTRFIGKGMARDLLWREPHTSNYVKIGDRVAVTYRLSADTPTAVQVRIAPRNGK
jgi:hypothetical protein